MVRDVCFFVCERCIRVTLLQFMIVVGWSTIENHMANPDIGLSMFFFGYDFFWWNILCPMDELEVPHDFGNLHVFPRKYIIPAGCGMCFGGGAVAPFF